MNKNITKNILWLAAIIVIIFSVIYIKFYYPLSQLQLRSNFRHAIATPIEHFYNANESRCGIWYESNQTNNVTKGRRNASVKKCFEEAFKKCDHQNILLVRANQNNDNKIIYSLIRVIKPNDQNQCIIQNYYEEDELEVREQNAQPIGYINTCTMLASDFFSSCEPVYFADMKKQAKE